MEYNTNQLEDLSNFAKMLVTQIPAGSWVYLVGDLGLGKTTFSQYFIQHKGYTGRVTSPTYAIMQDYSTKSGKVIHCDLYRLADPEELYEIGLIDLAIDEQAICLIEWPKKGQGALPPADFTINFFMDKHHRWATLNAG